MRALLQFLLAGVCVCIAVCGCPSPSQLPSKQDGKIFCAKLFLDYHTNAHISCRGKSFSVFNDDTVPKLKHEMNDKVSAIVVQYGCRLTTWEHSDFKGASRTFVVGIHPNLSSIKRGFWAWNNWNDIISSYKCQCTGSGLPTPRKATQAASLPASRSSRTWIIYTLCIAVVLLCTQI